jgi:hypothetical protein
LIFLFFSFFCHTLLFSFILFNCGTVLDRYLSNRYHLYTCKTVYNKQFTYLLTYLLTYLHPRCVCRNFTLLGFHLRKNIFKIFGLLELFLKDVTVKLNLYVIKKAKTFVYLVTIMYSAADYLEMIIIFGEC